MGLQADILAGIRRNVNEIGVTSGTWDDTNIYKDITEGLIKLISDLYSLQERRGKIEPGYVCETLSIIEKEVIFNLTSGVTDYTIASSPLSITDYLFNQALEVDLANTAVLRPATYLSLREMRERKANDFTAPNVKFPAYTISKKVLKVYPAPSTNVTAGGRFVYIEKPADVGSGTDITLGSECKAALEYYATWKCFKQFRKATADKWLELYQNEVQKLS